MRKMNDVNVFGCDVLTLCREAVTTSDLGLAGLTALERSTFLQECWTGGAVDGPVHWRREEDGVRLSYMQFNLQVFRCVRCSTGAKFKAENRTLHFLLLRELSPSYQLFFFIRVDTRVH